MDKQNPQLVDVLDAIKAGAGKCRVTAERIDDDERNEQITPRVLRAIREADFVIVDLTHERPNVFYEAGYAHGIGKIPIYVAREGTNFHFDVKDYPVITFRNMKELRDGITKRLRAVIKNSVVSDTARNVASETATIRTSAPDPIPDMPIAKLFSQINPLVLDRTRSDDAPWETVGLEIRDKLSLRQLRIWGREVLEGMGKVTDADPGLQEIEPSYWQSADFTYAFFDSTAGKAAHVAASTSSHLPSYTDLQVNRAQVEGIWPKPNLRLLLAQHRREGVEIRNAGSRLELEDSDFNAWLAKVTDWMERAISLIAQIDPADAEWFRILDAVPDPRVPLYRPRKHHEGAHLKAHREHDFRLVRLEQLIDRYAAKGAAVYA